MPKIFDMLAPSTSVQSIVDRLCHELSNGHFAAGARFYSNNSLATRFGVSAPTAAKVLNTLSADQWVERVHGSGTYVSDKVANQRVTTYATVSWFDMNSPATDATPRYKMATSFEQACVLRARNAPLVNLNDADHAATLAALVKDGLAGAFVLPRVEDPHIENIISDLLGNGIPCVTWTTEGVPHEHKTLSQGGMAVTFDDVQHGRMAAEHLLAMGHRSIAMLCQASRPLWARMRAQGVSAALTKAGIPKRQQIFENIPPEAMRPSALISRLRQLIGRGCTAIVASNDELAYELMLAAKCNGIQIPQDLSITGMDNVNVALLTGITTIATPLEHISLTALDLLEAAHRGDDVAGERRRVPGQLISRTSTGALHVK